MTLRPVTNIRVALETSLRARHGVYAGRTWGDFRRAMGMLGVRDDDELASIEYGIRQCGTGHLCREDDEHGYVEIREE